MKLRYSLLFVLAVTLFAGLAKAGPVDPTVILNDPHPSGLSSSCPANALCLFGLQGVPATIVFQLTNGFFPQTSFQYTGPTTNTFFVVLDDTLPGETFTCASNVFMSCSVVSNFDFFDWDHDGIVFEFTNGTFTQDATLMTGVVATPEPTLMCQLLLGVLPLLFFGRKYWVTDQAA